MGQLDQTMSLDLFTLDKGGIHVRFYATYTMRSPVRRTSVSRMCLSDEANGKDWLLSVPRWAA